MAKKANPPDATGFIMFPLVVHAMDCLAGRGDWGLAFEGHI